MESQETTDTENQNPIPPLFYEVGIDKVIKIFEAIIVAVDAEAAPVIHAQETMSYQELGDIKSAQLYAAAAAYRSIQNKLTYVIYELEQELKNANTTK